MDWIEGRAMDWQELIKRHEGFRPHPYRDSAGHLTIGYGTNLEAEGMTEREAEFMLYSRVIRMIAELGSYVWLQELDPVRQAAIIDMAYTLGVAGFRGFHITIENMAAKNYDRAADAILNSKWASEAPIRCAEIANMIRTGQWPS
jgi:lysozyme